MGRDATLRNEPAPSRPANANEPARNELVFSRKGLLHLAEVARERGLVGDMSHARKMIHTLPKIGEEARTPEVR